MAYNWQEIVDGGRHRFTCTINETQLTIEKTDIPGAWFCVLPNGKRVIGELRTVRWIVEKFAQVRNG